MPGFTWPKGLGDAPEPQQWEDGKPAEKAEEQPEQGTANRLKAEKK